MYEDIIKFIGSIALVLLMVLYGSLVGGLLIFNFYNWFLLPVFPSLPEITYTMAIGLGFFKMSVSRYETKKDERKTDWGFVFIMPWVVMLFGWVAYAIIY
jgi:hypothetical protein